MPAMTTILAIDTATGAALHSTLDVARFGDGST